MKRAPTLLPSMRWHFGNVVSKLMETHDPPLNNSQLADRADLNLETVGNLVKGRYTPAADTQNKVAAALGVTREWILSEVDRMNSAGNVLPMRSGKDREEDKDPILRAALDLGRRISRLEPLHRAAIDTFVAALEQSEDRVRRLQQQLDQAFDRNRKP